MTKPTFEHEQLLWQQGLKHIAGVDEVGRGCFAGPVVAAAVILPSTFTATDGINDSKKLSPKKRKELETIIKKHALAYSIAEIPVDVINNVGIGKATQQAFVHAINSLSVPPDHILIDAFFIEGLNKNIQKPIIHGDSISLSIAAASIIAKVYRDELMERVHEKYLPYDFATNKGYGTKKHQDAIRTFGLSDFHRTSFNLGKFTSALTV